jgi:DNA-binding transcriptional regulator of glucitol operon
LISISSGEHQKNNIMDIPQFLLGVGMICIGIFIVVLQIKRFKNGLKDQLGYGRGLLLTGFFFIIGGIIIIVKSF